MRSPEARSPRVLHVPRAADLPEPCAAAARWIGHRLRQAGHRGWIVGGAVRDLALRRSIEEIDMASDATPERMAQLFERIEEIGRAFGTVLVHAPSGLVQHTTFRLESVYRDARHPDEVAFSGSLELDAQRRDFTCNAMYLDPLDDTFLDPQGGLKDLEAGRLRCVGDPAARLQEDALRMVRMARFAAALDLEIDASAIQAAREHAERLARVAAERILVELDLIVVLDRAAIALEVLHRCGLLESCLPGWEELGQQSAGPGGAVAHRARVFELLGGRQTSTQGMAVLLDPRMDPGVEVDPSELEEALQMLERLKPSRELRRGVQELWKLRAELDGLAGLDAEAFAERRASAIRLIREREFSAASQLSRAWMEARGLDLRGLQRVERFASSLSPSEIHPEPLLSSRDLLELGFPPGPDFGVLQTQLEDMQLAAKLTSRGEAIDFARKRIAERARGSRRDQDGGKDSRSQTESG